MKKLIFLLGLIAFLGVNAQEIIVEEGVNYAYYTGTADDTINGVATMDAIFYVKLAAKARYILSWMASGDTLVGCDGNVTIQPQGSYDGVVYSNIGSSTTWTTTANYDANTSINTYTTLASGTLTNAQHTRTTAAFNIWAYDSLIYDDTLHVPAQTQTVAAQTFTDARTVTVTLPGCDYRFIKILFTGASSARVEIDKVAIKVTPITIP